MIADQLAQMDDAILLGIKAREKTGPGLATHGEIGVGILKQHAIARQLIEMRRLHQRMTVSTDVAVQVIRNDEEHILGFCVQTGRSGKRHNQQSTSKLKQTRRT